MAYNGSGTFAPYTPGNPVVTGTVISSTAFNATVTDIASGLTNAVTRDGQSPPSANLPMGGRKHTGLAAGVVAGDSLRFEQLFSQGAPASLPSAATTDIGGQNSVAVEISGTTGITSFGTNYNGPRYLRFTGVLLLTHGASLNLPGAANITTAVGDTCIAYPNSASSGWNVVQYQRAAFTPQTAAPAQSGANSDITSLTGLTSPIAETRQIQPIGASVAASALTISASALSLEFRSATLTSGAVSFVEGTPANLVVPSAATLGTVSAVQSRIVVLALNNAGTIELAVVNIAGGNDLTETGLISTTAISAGSTSASVVYSTTARTSVAYRVLGYIESTQATAGTWATAPSTIQGVGGQALTAMSSLGYGQTYQSVTRTPGTTYYNTTGKPIVISAGMNLSTTNAFTIGGVATNGITTDAVTGKQLTFVIPPGMSYSYSGSSFLSAFELR